MAEPAGLALGAFALAGLFDSCIQSFRHVVSGVDYSENCEILLAKLAAEKLSLQQWGDRVGIMEDIEARRHPRLSDSTTSKTINEVLACVSLVLNNSKKLEEKYGLCSKQDADDGEAPVEEATSQNSNVAFTKLRDRISRRRKRAKLLRVTQWVVVDYEKFERLVTLLQYFTQRLNDFCPIEPKPLEGGGRDSMKNNSALNPVSSQATQIDTEATQEPHDETGAPPNHAVEEAIDLTLTINEESPAPVPDNLEAEIAEELGTAEINMADSRYETCSIDSAAHAGYPKKSLSWSVDDIMSWRLNITSDDLVSSSSVSEVKGSLLFTDGSKTADHLEFEVRQDVKELMKLAGWCEQMWTTIEVMRVELDHCRDLNNSARKHQEAYMSLESTAKNSSQVFPSHGTAIFVCQHPHYNNIHQDIDSVEYALQNSNGRERLTSHIEKNEVTDAQVSSIAADPGVKITVVGDVDGEDTARRSLRHESIGQVQEDLTLGFNQQQSPSITNKGDDKQLEGKFEELFEQFASQMMQDPESMSCNDFEQQIKDYCKQAVDDLKVDLAQQGIPVAISILSKLQEGTTKVVDMLKKVKGLQKQLKSSAAQLSGPQERVDGKGEDLSKFQKACFGTDRQRNWLSQSLSDEVEDVLQKKLKRNFSNGERPKL